MQNTRKCVVCSSECEVQVDHECTTVFYSCPVCGRFQYSPFDKMNKNKLAPYLFYHSFKCGKGVELRYHTGLDKETCDRYRKKYDEGNGTHGRPVHMDMEIISNWYPKTFSERVDNILLYIGEHIPHIGQEMIYNWQELLSMLFVDRYDITEDPVNIGCFKHEERSDDELNHEVQYMLNYLRTAGYIEWECGASGEDDAEAVSLTPQGYKHIEQLQKYFSHGRNVLVAMKFGDDTIRLREAIRKGIADAGYIAVFIDEVQHNDFITPELLKYIRDSKFVVVDLTHQNNGAYFEEGYAMGLGKPVIQLCQKDQRLHFDIAQKNTIMWGVEDDIPERLKNRIIATIE